MIVCFGTINVDLVTSVARFPVPGETIKGDSYKLFAGGKGGNQALAAAQAGAEVIMCGAVGPDHFAAEALANLKAAGVDLSLVRAAEAPTGLFMIAIDPTGENLMIGANSANYAARAEWLAPALVAGRWLVTQNSLGIPEVEAAIAMARAAGCRIVFNAAPADPIDEAVFTAADIIIVNEHEARSYGEMLGLSSDPVGFARDCAARFERAVVVTLGPDGVVAAFDGRLVAADSPRITAVDTTGAGDAFCGALAAALDRGDGYEQAIREGIAAGTLACLAEGAQTSFRGRAEIAALSAGIHFRTIAG